MKNKITKIRLLGGICAAFCWWGLLYPELTMTPDTYEVFWEEADIPEEDVVEGELEEDIYRIVLEADRDQIRFKSRFLEYLEIKRGK